MRYLSAPEREGRGALTAGLDQAARFVAARFAAVGLSPGGDRGSFFEAVDIPIPPRPSTDTRLALGDEALALGVDFVPNAGSATTRAAGPLVFVGHGSVVPGGRDDFAGIDVRGKVLLSLVTGSVPTARLLESAIARGAIGVLFVDGDAGPRTETAIQPLPAFTLEEVSAIASFHVRAAAIDRVLAPSGTTVTELDAALRSALPHAISVGLPSWATFAVAWAPPSVKGSNVLGLLQGSDPALQREAVVLGAHYDHLGWGDEGGSLDGRRLHPGADDNASGTAALLAAASALAGARPRPRRSILFVAFTGEEKSWAGSRRVAALPPKIVVAMLNLDMVGRMRANALEVNGAATSPEWQAIVEAANVATSSLRERLRLTFPRAVPPGSDHEPFILSNVPALFFFTGLHCDYHRGSDTWDKINAEGLVQVARLAAGVTRSVADRPGRLPFDSPSWADRQLPRECAR